MKQENVLSDSLFFELLADLKEGRVSALKANEMILHHWLQYLDSVDRIEDQIIGLKFDRDDEVQKLLARTQVLFINNRIVNILLKEDSADIYGTQDVITEFYNYALKQYKKFEDDLYLMNSSGQRIDRKLSAHYRLLVKNKSNRS